MSCFGISKDDVCGRQSGGQFHFVAAVLFVKMMSTVDKAWVKYA